MHADEALLKMGEMQAQVDSLAQKAARGSDGGAGEEKSLGEQFTDSEGFKAFQASGFSRHAKADLHLKTTLTTTTTPGNGAVGTAIRATRLEGVRELPQRRLTIRGLLAQGRMDGNALEYVREVAFRNNAATVAETVAKPESDFQLENVSTGARVIAHWMKATRQALDDIAQLRSMIDSRLLLGLALQEEAQILNGDGTGQNLSGLMPNATAYAAPLTIAGATSIDMLRLAMLQASVALYPPTGVVLNPIDWGWIELQKDADGRYLIGNPQGAIGATLWNLPVVPTFAMAQDAFLVGAFDMGAQLFDRWDARVEVGYVNDDFTRNQVTILAEERLALAIYRPAAFIKGDFGRVA